MLGFGGHFATKSRRYSTTHKRCAPPAAPGNATNDWCHRHHTAADDSPSSRDHAHRRRPHLAGIGWNTTADAHLAASAAARARAYRRPRQAGTPAA